MPRNTWRPTSGRSTWWSQTACRRIRAARSSSASCGSSTQASPPRRSRSTSARRIVAGASSAGRPTPPWDTRLGQQPLSGAVGEARTAAVALAVFLQVRCGAPALELPPSGGSPLRGPGGLRRRVGRPPSARGRLALAGGADSCPARFQRSSGGASVDWHGFNGSRAGGPAMWGPRRRRCRTRRDPAPDASSTCTGDGSALRPVRASCVHRTLHPSLQASEVVAVAAPCRHGDRRRGGPRRHAGFCCRARAGRDMT